MREQAKHPTVVLSDERSKRVQVRPSRRKRSPFWLRPAVLAFPALARLHELRAAAHQYADPFALVTEALARLRIGLHVPEDDLQRIPLDGPAVIVANHPFGGLDGLAAIETIGRRRRDLRILANGDLSQLEGLGTLIIPVDPFGGQAAARSNVSGLRKAVRWVQESGVLLIYPAGEVSHIDLRTLSVTDPPWSATAARLVRLTGARVVPMYFAGSNSALFQIAGLLHPRLRTLLLPHELANKTGARVDVRLGEAIGVDKLRSFDTDTALTAYLKLRTYLLRDAPATCVAAARETPCERELQPLAPAVGADLLQQEIEALPAESLLVGTGALRVYGASAAQLQWTLQEIGRLREKTFRAVGEGTGRSSDLDAFDQHYEHLFVWNGEKREVVGAYRLGRVDRILRTAGKRGLYTATLFDYREPFLALLGPALELGRSFVSLEYQKSFAPLLLLWKGIGEYVGRHPQYGKLLGPVSVSNDYQSTSRDLLIEFLRKHSFDHFSATLVRARRPFRRRFSLRSLGSEPALPSSVEALSSLVAGLEPDGKGVPVLLRQYLKLGGRILGFNVDAGFGHCIDCLLLVDLRKTDPAVLKKYLSERARQNLFAHRPQRIA